MLVNQARNKDLKWYSIEVNRFHSQAISELWGTFQINSMGLKFATRNFWLTTQHLVWGLMYFFFMIAMRSCMRYSRSFFPRFRNGDGAMQSNPVFSFLFSFGLHASRSRMPRHDHHLTPICGLVRSWRITVNKFRWCENDENWSSTFKVRETTNGLKIISWMNGFNLTRRAHLMGKPG